MRFHRIMPVPAKAPSHRAVGYDLAGVKYTRLLRADTFTPTELHAITIMLEGSEPVDYLRNPLSLPLCSHRFREIVLTMCADQVEFVPVTLHSPAGIEARYLFMNVIHYIDCVDMDRSVVSSQQIGKSRHVIEFAFRPDRIPDGVHLLKVPEASSTIYLSETLARSFTADFTGYGFLPNRV